MRFRGIARGPVVGRFRGISSGAYRYFIESAAAFRALAERALLELTPHDTHKG